MSRSKVFFIVGMLALSYSCIAQTNTVFEDWNTVSGTQNNFQRSIVRSKGLSGATYYYVCGSTLNSSGNYDILVQKKNASGVVLWSNTYNGAGNANDYATDVQIDGIGNVYVCGTYYKDATDSNNAVVIKYNKLGTHKWTKTYNGAGSRHDAYAAMQLSTNAIVAVGTTWQGSTNKYDILAVRLDTNGNQIWASSWDYTTMNDGAVNLWASGNNVFVAGGAQSASTTYKYAVVKLKASDGSLVTATVTGGTAFGFDKVADFQMDLSGNIYLTGSVLNVTTLYDFKTVKLDTALNIIWSATYDGGNNLNDFASGLCVDTAGNVIVTGCKNSSTSAQDYVTVKYSKTGVQRWVTAFDGGTNAQDSATAIAVRDTTQIYVTGYSYDSAATKNYYTIKYNGAGTLQWKIAFNSWRNGSDVATAIAVDSIGGIIVSGQSDLDDTDRVYTTVRYTEKGIITPPDTVNAAYAFLFEENHGQLYNTDTLPEASIQFYCKATWPPVFFSDTAVTYVWSSIDTSDVTNDTMHRVDMKLIGSNPVNVYPKDKQETYFNYLQGYLDYPLENVPLYSQLVYPNVYSKIDAMYTSNVMGLKHYFIIRTGGNASDIEMDFVGADSVKIVNDTLMVYTVLGTLKQRQATAFEIDNSGTRVPIAWQPDYSINGSGNVEFINIGSYTSGRTLVFECDWGAPPSSTSSIATLEWSTFFPNVASNNNYGTHIEANSLNVSWMTGTTGAGLIIGQVGPTINPFTGNVDGFMARFSSAAQSQWITYFGGSGSDYSSDLAVDGSNNSYAVGQTGSSDFTSLSTSGINDISYAGGGDGFIIVFDAFGYSICDSYIGGTSYDYTTSIDLGKATTLDIYLVGFSYSTSGLPFVTGGNYNQQYNAGSSDGFIMRLDNSYNNIWATSYGGSGNDRFIDVSLRDPSNNPVVVGVTTSQNYSSTSCVVPPTVGDFPFCDNGGAYYSQGSGGGVDAIIVEFDNTNQQLIWSTFFGGSQNEGGGIFASAPGAVAPSIEVINDNVYVAGNVFGYSVSFPSLNSPIGNYNQAYGNSSGGNYDGYLAKFDSNRQQVWTTYIGATAVTLFDVTSDPQGNIYLAGVSDISTVATSPNLCQPAPINSHPICDYSGFNYMETTNTGIDRMFIMAFDQYENIIWSTLFGQNGFVTNAGVYCTTDKLFLTGASGVAYTPLEYDVSSTTDYYQPTDPSGSGANAVISRFDITQIVGISEQQQSDGNQFSIYPNPSSDFVTLQLSKTAVEGTTIQVVDLTGRVVSQQQTSGSDLYYTIDVSDLAVGMYFIELVNNEGTISQKFIKN